MYDDTIVEDVFFLTLERGEHRAIAALVTNPADLPQEALNTIIHGLAEKLAEREGPR